MKRSISHSGGLILKEHTRRIFRMKVVVTTITQRIKTGENKSDAISELETLHSTSKLSIEKLTDAVKKHKN